VEMKTGRRLWDKHPHVRGGDELTFGERAADVMRGAFGSWVFVGAFLLAMAVWMVVNTTALRNSAFDRYPYILLNLMLSMMAGLQGALILIAAKRADRVAAEQALHHYGQTAAIKDLQDQQMLILNELKRLNESSHGRPLYGPEPGDGVVGLGEVVGNVSPDQERAGRRPGGTMSDRIKRSPAGRRGISRSGNVARSQAAICSGLHSSSSMAWMQARMENAPPDPATI